MSMEIILLAFLVFSTIFISNFGVVILGIKKMEVVVILTRIISINPIIKTKLKSFQIPASSDRKIGFCILLIGTPQNKIRFAGELMLNLTWNKITGGRQLECQQLSLMNGILQSSGEEACIQIIELRIYILLHSHSPCKPNEPFTVYSRQLTRFRSIHNYQNDIILILEP